MPARRKSQTNKQTIPELSKTTGRKRSSAGMPTSAREARKKELYKKHARMELNSKTTEPDLDTIAQDMRYIKSKGRSYHY